MANARGGCATFHGRRQRADAAEHMHHALAVRERGGQRGAQRGFVLGRDIKAGHRQLDGVFLEPINAWETGGRQKVAIHAQVCVATRTGPVGQLGVHALAVHHQRRQQADVLAPEVRQQLRSNALGRLRLHGGAIFDAVLRAELDVQEAQEMPHLGRGAHGGLAPAARQALLDGDSGRDAIHRIHLGPTGGLDDAPRIRVERFEVTALAFVEQDVERQRGLARAAHAGHHVELAAWNVHAQVLEVVFFGVDDLYGIFGLWRFIHKR